VHFVMTNIGTYWCFGVITAGYENDGCLLQLCTLTVQTSEVVTLNLIETVKNFLLEILLRIRLLGESDVD